MELFCPICGSPLVDNGVTFSCVDGGMDLSKAIAAHLMERYSPENRALVQAPNLIYNERWHRNLRWYCPGCGHRLNHYLECESCDKHLRDLVYPLIERHYHRRMTNG